MVPTRYGRDTRVPRYYSCSILMCTSSTKFSTSRSIRILNLMCENRVNILDTRAGAGTVLQYLGDTAVVLEYGTKSHNGTCATYIFLFKIGFLTCS